MRSRPSSPTPWLVTLGICAVLSLAAYWGMSAAERLPKPNYGIMAPIAAHEINAAAVLALTGPGGTDVIPEDPSPLTIRPRVKQEDLANFLHASITRQGGAATLTEQGTKITIRAVLTPEHAGRITSFAKADTNSQLRWISDETTRDGPATQPSGEQLIHQTIIVKPATATIAGADVNLIHLWIASGLVATIAGPSAVFIAAALAITWMPLAVGSRHRQPGRN